MEAAPLSQSHSPHSAATLSHSCQESAAKPLSAPGWRSLSAIVLLLAAGLSLRFWMLHKFFQVNGDAEIYGGIAKNLLLHGRYALNGAGEALYPTIIRLPGYPIFLAICFKLFGMENYWAVGVVQIFLELAGCLLLADVARRIAPARCGHIAGWATLILACLCPFAASYSDLPLTECATVFSIAVALWSAERFGRKIAWSSAVSFTCAIAFAALLRPDGALVGVALAPVMLFALRRQRAEGGGKNVLVMAAVCLLLALLPFAGWTVRNERVFHLFQPLAPRYATEPGESTHPGWIRWIRSWCTDFNCTYQVYWPVPGDVLDMTALPPTAFDSAAQQAETTQLAADYNNGARQLTDAIDARFNHLAEEREAGHPWRTRLWMPIARMADMWLRPRIENLPIDADWSNYAHHHAETRFSWMYVALNGALLLMALGGLLLRPRLAGAMALYMALRSLLLLTVEAPEARYTLECFPMIFVLGGVCIGSLLAPRGSQKQTGAEA